MKFFLILSFIPIIGCSQDCKVNKETDPFTKETKLSTGFLPLREASVTIDADAKEIDVFFSLQGTDICFDNNGTVAIYFEGTKQKQTYRNGGTMNCEGLFHIIFRNTATPQTGIQKLTTIKVTSLLFTGNNKKETKVELNAEQQLLFMQIAGCLLTEAKAIVK